MNRVTQHGNYSAIILPVDFSYLGLPNVVVYSVLQVAFMVTVVVTVALMVSIGVLLFMMYGVFKDWFLTISISTKT